MRSIKTKIILLFTVLCCVFSIYASAAGSVSVFVNGKALANSSSAVLMNGTVMLPFRSVFNALGVPNNQITWNQGLHSIEVRTSDQKYIFLVVGSRGALVDDKMLTLPVTPFIQNGSTFVPVRFVSEALGATVKWDNATQRVLITK